MKIKNWHIITGLIVLSLIAIVSLGNEENTVPPPPKKEAPKQERRLECDNGLKLLAYNIITDNVKASLKAPRAATFPGLHEKVSHVTCLNNNTVNIISWVDAPNSFGATRRAAFTAVMRFTDRESYKVLEFQLLTD